MVELTLDNIRNLSLSILAKSGFGQKHAAAIADTLTTCQFDDCQSHGLFRLFMCNDTMKAGKIDGHVTPVVAFSDNAIVRVDARGGMSLLAFREALPVLIEKTRTHGIAAMAINRFVARLTIVARSSARSRTRSVKPDL